jgi:uncharacterized protein YhaN
MALSINRLALAPWGSFEDRSLHFSGGSGVVELVDGPNAAGKSTIARAQIALLFGIPARTVDAHTHPYQDLAIRAELLIDGVSVEVVRRKRNLGSLCTPDGTALRDDPIPAALGGMSREIFASFFHVDHDTLVKGGEDLLRGEGEVGASLFAAAAGISALHAHLATFDERANSVFRPHASSTALMQELGRLREHAKQLKQSLVRPAAHKRMVHQLEDLQSRSAHLLNEVTAVARQIAELECLLAVTPLISRRDAVTARRRELGEVPMLQSDASQRRAAAAATLQSERTQRDHQRRQRDHFAALLSALVLDEQLINRAPEIAAVIEQIPVVEKAESDRRRLEVEIGHARAEVEAAAYAVGVSAKALGQLRRPESARRQLDQVLDEGTRLRERLDSAKERHQTAADQYDDLVRAPADAAKPLDLSALEASVRAARPRAGLDDQLAGARRHHERLQREARRALASLSPAPASLEDLLDLPALQRDAVDALLASSRQLHDDQLQLDADRRQLDARHAEHAGLAEQLRHHGQVSTALDVQDSRAQRDQQWRGLVGAIRSGRSPEGEAVGLYEAAVATADESADELIRDAAGAELARRVAADKQQIATITSQLDNRQRSIDRDDEDLARDWAEVWAVTGLEPITLDRARDWERAREAAQAAARAADEADDTATTLAQQLARSETAMRRKLAGYISLPEMATMAELIELAEGLIEHNEAAAAHALRRRETLEHGRRELRAAEKELTAAKDGWQHWLSAWPERSHAAGLPERCEPEQAQDLARMITDGLSAQRQAEQLQARVTGIDRDRTQLQDRLEALVGDIAADLIGRDTWQAAAILKDRLAEQQRRRTERAELTRRHDEADAAATTAETACEKARQELNVLCQMAACESVDELLGVEARCEDAAELDREIRELEVRIADRGGDDVATLAERVAELDREETTNAVTRLAEKRQSLEQERDSVKEEIGQAKLRIAATEEDTEAVSAAEDVEFSQARIVELARQYAVARLSASVIRRAVERYRDHNENPLVARANELFSRFTEGTYAELFVDVDDKGRGCLVARTNNRVIHTMEQMSKGTREQLFLALRIAAIERYVERSGPVPVLFDDVFVESDDARCAEIFAALGELSQQTQVIVLTHHHHMVAIARDALGPNLHVQELPAAQSRLRAAA